MTNEDHAPRTDGRTARQDASVKDTLHDRHPARFAVTDEALQDFLDDQNIAVDRLVRMERLRRDQPFQWARLVQYAERGSRDRVRLLRVLVEHRLGVTYQDLAERLDVSDRRVRDFVKDLRDAGVVETPGRPAQVRFTDEDQRALAADVVRFL